MHRHQLLDELDAAEPTAVVAARVAEARDRMRRRLQDTPWRRNADVPGGELRRRWPLPAATTSPLETSTRSGRVSARGVDRVLRVAWTLADLDGADRPDREHVLVAAQLRGDQPITVPRAEPSPARLSAVTS